MKERAVGERIVVDRYMLIVEKKATCEGCFFNMSICERKQASAMTGPCSRLSRSDKTSVIFKLIKQ